MYELINAAMAGRTTAELVEALDLVGVPCGPISTVDQVFENEQVLHTGQRRTVQHPTAGEITLTGFPYAFSGAELEIAHTPPLLGEQTREILGELGYDEGAVAQMFASGAVAGQ